MSESDLNSYLEKKYESLTAYQLRAIQARYRPNWMKDLEIKLLEDPVIARLTSTFSVSMSLTSYLPAQERLKQEAQELILARQKQVIDEFFSL